MQSGNFRKKSLRNLLCVFALVLAMNGHTSLSFPSSTNEQGVENFVPQENMAGVTFQIRSFSGKINGFQSYSYFVPKKKEVSSLSNLISGEFLPVHGDIIYLHTLKLF